jgi:type IV pilus assembly protein PilW
VNRQPIRPHDTMVDMARRQDGFTLLEMVVAILIAALIIAAGFAVLTTTSKAVRANDQTVDTQQNVRIAMTLLARDIKEAGFGMVGPVGACAVAGTPAAIVPQDNTPGGPDTGPDAISLVVPSTSSVAPLWTLAVAAGAPGVGGFNQITLQAGAVAAMQAAGLVVGSTISINGAITATIQTINAGANTLTLTSAVAAPAAFPVGAQVHLLQCMTYQVILPPDNNQVCLGSAPCLVRGVAGAGLNCNIAASPCLPIVDGVEDLQLAYACDGCSAAVNGGVADKEIDDLNASGSFDQGDFWTNSTWATPPLIPATIRLVQVNIVARQTAADTGFGEENKTGVLTAGPILISDHNPANDAGYNAAAYSQLRRRVLIRAVETRNIGLS